MLEYIMLLSIVVLIVCIGMLVIRFILGPSEFDRLAVLETFSPALLCIFALWGVIIDTHWFFDVILVLSLVGFLSTVACIKYVEQQRLGDD